jgi:hypothetical protein
MVKIELSKRKRTWEIKITRIEKTIENRKRFACKRKRTFKEGITRSIETANKKVERER